MKFTILTLTVLVLLFNSSTKTQSVEYADLKSENQRLRRHVDSLNLFAALGYVELYHSTSSTPNCPTKAMIADFDSLVEKTKTYRFKLDTMGMNLNDCRKQ